MNRVIIFIIAFSSFINTQAQSSKSIERADMYFKRKFFHEAIPLYEKAYKIRKSYKVSKNLADSYYNIYKMDKASQVYKYLIKNYSKLLSNEEYYLKYSNTLKAQNKHNNAYNVMHHYFKNQNDDVSLSKLKANKEYIDDVKAIGDRFTIKNLNINTPQSEFGAVQFGDKLIFAASKKQHSLFDKLYKWDGEHYLDLYQIDENKIHLGDSVATPLSEEINTKLHEATIAITKSGKTIYFTRNNFKKGKRKKDDKKITHLQIFKADFIDGQWKNISPLPFNSNDFSTEHPALSPDEKTLYFSSDMPGGFGSFDLYKVEILENGNFGQPINLGETINTNKKEQFPFISQDNKLYFSSNGHPGFGSLDVFVSNLKNNAFSKPDNVGLPVNSGYDDFSFNINPTTKEGYFASNRKGGKGNDDIYKIVEQKPLIIESCKQFISGTITDIDTKEILVNATIEIRNNNKKLEDLTTDAKGTFRFTTKCKATYNLKASKNGYKEAKKTITTSKERNKNNDASMQLKSIKAIEKEKALALELKKKKAEEIRKLEAANLIVKNKQRLNNIIDSEDDIIKNKEQLKIKTDEINFDYNLWYLRRDAKKAINKVVDLMKKYNNMVVEIGTHTDIRGKDKYNLNLSQKRATSVKAYLMEQGIEPDRIIAIGYGETKPIVKCKTEDSCTEEQHEINRRCDFVIKSIL